MALDIAGDRGGRFYNSRIPDNAAPEIHVYSMIPLLRSVFGLISTRTNTYSTSSAIPVWLHARLLKKRDPAEMRD